jgi:hypothetical protein
VTSLASALPCGNPTPDGGVRIPLTRGLSAVVDAADAALVGGVRWCVLGCAINQRYAARKERAGGPTILMHRVIVGAAKGQQVDHVNGDTLDNRRSNLRLATSAENGRNRARHRNNLSGYKGVSPPARGKQWTAEIRGEGRRIHLGSFATAEEAARAYDAAARHYFGAFARLNFPEAA